MRQSSTSSFFFRTAVAALIVGFGIMVLAGCAGKKDPSATAMNAQPAAGGEQAAETTMTAPEPIEGNGGKYMCPYTSDDALAGWAQKAMSAELKSTVGKEAGKYAGQQIGKEIGKQIPFAGKLIGDEVGKSIGKKACVEAAGGMEYIRESSDLSFDNVDDLAVYMYVNHGKDADYERVLRITMDVYPDLETRYKKAIDAAK